MPHPSVDFPALGFCYDENAEGYALYDEDDNLVCYIAQSVVLNAPDLAQILILVATGELTRDFRFTVH